MKQEIVFKNGKYYQKIAYCFFINRKETKEMSVALLSNQEQQYHTDSVSF